jgi:hypothetical protein
MLLTSEHGRLHGRPPSLPAVISRALYPADAQFVGTARGLAATDWRKAYQELREDPDAALLIILPARAAERLPAPLLDSRSLDFSASSFWSRGSAFHVGVNDPQARGPAFRRRPGRRHLAGAMLRLFVKLHAIEEAQARLGRRIAALEGAPASVVPISVPAPAAIPSPAPAPRKRGRPSGTLRRPNNGYSIEPRI